MFDSVANGERSQRTIIGSMRMTISDIVPVFTLECIGAERLAR